LSTRGTARSPDGALVKRALVMSRMANDNGANDNGANKAIAAWASGGPIRLAARGSDHFDSLHR